MFVAVSSMSAGGDALIPNPQFCAVS